MNEETQYRALQQGQTRRDPFEGLEWSLRSLLEGEPKASSIKIVEPFAGEGLLMDYMRQHGYSNISGFDIVADKKHYIVQRDCINDFPKGFDLCVTNPPWLDSALNSRNGSKVVIPEGYGNLAFYALSICLAHTPYVCSILPASFLAQMMRNFDRLSPKKQQFKRLRHISELHVDTFQEDSLGVIAFFGKEEQQDFSIEKKGKWSDYKDLRLPTRTPAIRRCVNGEQGTIGANLVDRSKKDQIKPFVPVDEITDKQQNEACRFNTRLMAPEGIKPTGANRRAQRWIKETRGLFLTLYRKCNNGFVRRRMLISDACALLSLCKTAPLVPYKEKMLHSNISQYIKLKYATMVDALVNNSTENAFLRGKFQGSNPDFDAGIPDITVYLKNGRFIFIEVKKCNGLLSEKQKAFIAKTKNPVFVLYGDNRGGTPKSMIDAIMCEYDTPNPDIAKIKEKYCFNSF